LAVALGVEATKRRYRVLFVKAADLVRQLIVELPRFRGHV